MRSPYLIALIVTLVGAFTYWYQNTAAVCPVPLSYRIGAIDPSFNLNHEEALVYAKKAEAVWEDQVGRELFVDDVNAEFVIDFVYDDRQATADSETEQRNSLDAQQKESEDIKAALLELQTQYDKLVKTYEDKAASYEARLATYNESVTMYNDRGGAPSEVYDELEVERTALSAEVEELNQLSLEVQSLAGKLNTLAEQGNALVDSYNRAVSEYNQTFGFSREFTQGDYQGDRITVYKFSTEAELVRVLAHEFGHALGLDHVEGESSLMYYLLENTDESPVLSSYDFSSYEVVCGYTESFTQKVRRLIREVLQK